MGGPEGCGGAFLLGGSGVAPYAVALSKFGAVPLAVGWSAASAPAAAAALVRLSASVVEFDPVPAMTWTLPAARSMENATTFSCSAWDSVGLSPVVPQGTIPARPASFWASIWLPKRS